MSAVYNAYSMIKGWLAAYVNLGVAKIWDVAVLALAMEELGGVISDPWGKPLKWTSYQMNWVASSNQTIADAMLKHTSKWKPGINPPENLDELEVPLV